MPNTDEVISMLASELYENLAKKMTLALSNVVVGNDLWSQDELVVNFWMLAARSIVQHCANWERSGDGISRMNNFERNNLKKLPKIIETK